MHRYILDVPDLREAKLEDLAEELYIKYDSLSSLLGDIKLTNDDGEYYIFHSFRLLKTPAGRYRVVDISNDKETTIANKFTVWMLINLLEKNLKEKRE